MAWKRGEDGVRVEVRASEGVGSDEAFEAHSPKIWVFICTIIDQVLHFAAFGGR